MTLQLQMDPHTWIIPTSLAPSPMAKVIAFTECLTSSTNSDFWIGDTL